MTARHLDMCGCRYCCDILLSYLLPSSGSRDRSLTRRDVLPLYRVSYDTILGYVCDIKNLSNCRNHTPLVSSRTPALHAPLSQVLQGDGAAARGVHEGAQDTRRSIHRASVASGTSTEMADYPVRKSRDGCAGFCLRMPNRCRGECAAVSATSVRL